MTVKNDRKLALNRTFNMFAVIGILILPGISYSLFLEEIVAGGIMFGVFALICIAMLAFLPYSYLFDQEGVSARYLFLPVERYLWNNIHAITVTYTTSGNPIWDGLFSGVFEISGRPEGKCRFYMQGHICKSKRTKRLLETYWDGTITGYFGEDIKVWWRKRVRKKEKQIARHLTDEIVPMEREIRARAREWLKPFIDQAAQLDLELRTEYRYITKDFEELKSRPHEGYTYTAVVSIARPSETDEDKMVLVSVDLLYVRLGRTAYRGVENKEAAVQVQDMFTDVLDEIRRNGLAAYCREKNES